MTTKCFVEDNKIIEEFDRCLRDFLYLIENCFNLNVKRAKKHTS